MAKLRNIVRNAVHPAYLRESVRKVADRVVDRKHAAGRASAVRWAQEHAVPARALSRGDGELWAEAEAATARIEREAPSLLAAAGTSFGGAGHTTLLYFLVRRHQPEVVVETGVAAGWSSRAILEALAANGSGHLWSSDLPYLGQQDPARSIGCLVPEALLARWTLLLEGDRRNLPRILEECGPIGLVHYDSDKSYRGRRWAIETLRPRLAPGAVIVMDDIDDNLFFADLAAEAPERTRVIAARKKFVGVLA
jgi:predicted O-methyltransferase YrrM